eukprot:gene6214-14151_t
MYPDSHYFLNVSFTNSKGKVVHGKEAVAASTKEDILAVSLLERPELTSLEAGMPPQD